MKIKNGTPVYIDWMDWETLAVYHGETHEFLCLYSEFEWEHEPEPFIAIGEIFDF